MKARNRVWIHDALLSDSSLSIPVANGMARLLYVFRGETVIEDESLQEGDSILIIDEEEISVHAESSAELVLFIIDRNAPTVRSGTLSGAN